MPSWLTLQNALYVLGVVGVVGNTTGWALTMLARVWPVLGVVSTPFCKFFLDWAHYFPPPGNAGKRGYARMHVLLAVVAVSGSIVALEVACKEAQIPAVIPPATDLIACVVSSVAKESQTLSDEALVAAVVKDCAADEEAVILAVLSSDDPNVAPAVPAARRGAQVVLAHKVARR